MNNNRRFTLNTNQNIIVEFTDERIIPASGLAVVGALLGKSDFAKKLNRMDDIGDSLRETILNENIELLISNKIQPTALPNGFVPVDIDVTPMDNSKSKKEGVSRTYKGFDGYAPIMAYIGTEGYAINFELREGKQGWMV